MRILVGKYRVSLTGSHQVNVFAVYVEPEGRQEGSTNDFVRPVASPPPTGPVVDGHPPGLV